ncbi:MAG: 50S ribosomal protein L3 [Candidatus Berkelbacteria bacterium]|nr:50S ribosomal protein L3 [Candidatus Berkelbacteria bacterium]
MKVFANKIGTTHIYDEKNNHKIVTVLQLRKTTVEKLKTNDSDGYCALVFVESDPKIKSKKPVQGQFKNVVNPRYITEERVSEEKIQEAKISDELRVDGFNIGDKITVVSKTKGKGFQGTIKRHSFNTGPKTHGSHNYRQPGSIGATYPERTLKGKKMAGHMGNVVHTQKNKMVVRVEQELNRIWINGHISGANKSRLLITK